MHKLFFEKKQNLNDGTAPIYLRLTVAGDRVEFTTRRYIKPERRNGDDQKMNGARVFQQQSQTAGTKYH
ncbi:Arm DNA-binding domain-containing protein [Mucilaginibacter sp. SMC90]|uniref:Arm DNA-binding domain-containing protein n=1 Tax=Mucilaginibacter sp. SMC90 TaxID=2929803 RepID=UPI001FB37FCC|nr:Arm DNA-binding domain-containing protein [Mucilaginibacter sp. SMC90]UOE50999.1 Arm DNA-binding domain-containing protein [Mucilaginibacter sp. SMC90]